MELALNVNVQTVYTVQIVKLALLLDIGISIQTFVSAQLQNQFGILAFPNVNVLLDYMDQIVNHVHLQDIGIQTATHVFVIIH